MRDIACAGYVAGCNTQFFTKKSDGTGYSLADGQTNIMRRLSFADDVGGSYQSMLAFPAIAAQFESGHLDTVTGAARRIRARRAARGSQRAAPLSRAPPLLRRS